LEKIQDAGFELFLVSNQPDHAKGKTTLKDLEKVHKKFDQLLTSQGIFFKEYYYCYHHPEGIILVILLNACAANQSRSIF